LTLNIHSLAHDALCAFDKRGHPIARRRPVLSAISGRAIHTIHRFDTRHQQPLKQDAPDGPGRRA
jgi:hypothetical protein